MKDTFKVIVTKSAAKEIRSFPKIVIRHIIDAAQRLSQNPRPPGCKKLKGD
jgi:hypothetical protein